MVSIGSLWIVIIMLIIMIIAGIKTSLFLLKKKFSSNVWMLVQVGYKLSEMETLEMLNLLELIFKFHILNTHNKIIHRKFSADCWFDQLSLQMFSVSYSVGEIYKIFNDICYHHFSERIFVKTGLNPLIFTNWCKISPW